MNNSFVKIILLGLVLITSCKTSTKNNKVENDIIKRLSVYYGEDYDSTYKYYNITDSHHVKSVNISFYHFYDKRDTSDDNNYWVGGVIAVNIATKNCFVIASKLKGRNKLANSCYATSKYIHGKIWKDDKDFQLYEDTFKTIVTNSLELLQERNMAVAMKLSAILNDIPITTKSTINRKIMDTLIRDFLFSYIDEHYQLSPSFDFRMSALKRINIGSNKIMPYNRKPGKSILNQGKLQIAYSEFMKKRWNDENVFIYVYESSLLFRDEQIMVVINDGLKSKSITKQNYYSIFYKEPILFDIKIYSENL